MSRRPPDRKVVHKFERPGRSDLSRFVRALDDVEPPDLWDDVLESALEPGSGPPPMRKLEMFGRERHRLALLVAAAVMVLAVAGGVLAIGTDRTREVTMAGLGISSSSDSDDAGPASPSGEPSAKSDGDGSEVDGSADSDERGGGRETRSSGGKGEPGRDDGRAEPGDEATAEGRLEGGETTVPPDVPSDRPSSPTSLPTTTTSPTTLPVPPEIWGRIWVAVDLRSPTDEIHVEDLGLPQRPLLDLTETGVVRFSWCNGFSVRVEVIAGRLVTEPDSFATSPTSICGDDTGTGEAIVRTLLESSPEVGVPVDGDQLTLAAGPFSASFVAEP